MKNYLFIWLLICVCCNNLFAQEEQHKEKLLQQLEKSEPNKDRLSILYSLIQISYLAPREQAVYIERLLQESEKQKNNHYKCQAYLSYIIQAYNGFDGDEVNRLMTLLEPLARKEKLYDMLFRGKQCVIDMLFLKEEYELEEKEALKMLEEAQHLKNINGQIGAYHSLAHVYLQTYRAEQAFNVLEKAIRLGPLCNNPNIYHEVLRTMTIVCAKIKDMPNWFKYLQIRDSLINSDERTNMNADRLINNISYLQYYVNNEEWEKAAESMASVESLYSEQYEVVYKYYYITAKIEYYSAIKEWAKALKEVNKALPFMKTISGDDYTNYLIQKAKLLKLTGQDKEAVTLYKQAKLLKDTLGISIIDKQAKQLKNSYKADLQVLDKETQRQQIQQVFLALSGIVIFILIIYIIHAHHIKRKLSKAEQDMRDMMNETEQANKIKERFLSNINMAIREPLDIIVNNSSVLASDGDISETEKEQLSNTIGTTSDKLIELINDILVLSKLEAGMMKFILQDIDIIQLLRDSASKSNLTQAGKTSLQLSDNTTCNIKGDANYLTMIFNNILKAPIETNKNISISQEQTGTPSLHIMIMNSLLAGPNPSQDIAIRNEINRMLTECFGGTYKINPSDSTIHITF